MDEEKELILSINEANSLKKITKMPGWKIIENFLDKSVEKYDKELKSQKIMILQIYSPAERCWSG